MNYFLAIEMENLAMIGNSFSERGINFENDGKKGIGIGSAKNSCERQKFVEYEECIRREIAKEVQNGLYQILAIAKIRLYRMKMGVTLTERELLLTSIESSIDDGLQCAKSLSAQLYPPMLHNQGLIHALRWLLRDICPAYGVNAELIDMASVEPEDSAVRVILFRAVRELLINAVKHSRSNNVALTIHTDRENNLKGVKGVEYLKISLADNGNGFDWEKIMSREGDEFCLASVRERISHVGGSMMVSNYEGLGTTITLSVPLE